MDDKEYIAKELANFFKDEPWKAVYWLMAENPMFGEVSPCHLIELGRIHKVRQYIEAALAENKPSK